ncbi:MAG: hypothetical protein A2452_01915 [Candidatus Firestonebacteria bacterium RIFOXYC2_FULL_39_67]|nr:MAG: hypothetical protein A2536_12725 [Candidatus Firestonebacteria bacterium RIFOXYD2_FULL_39_29]OGF57071.1 MAG: hypothetical protein A2452_01915 [Candidatus Firestonebacteria bacterium RIFOXYC2_FULL_39_67]
MMNKKKYSKLMFIALLSVNIFILQSFAEETTNLQQKTELIKFDTTKINLTGKLGVSFGYPYAAIKYGLSASITGEVKVAFDFVEPIYVFSGRVYYNIYRDSVVIGYVGLEGGWTTFNTEGTAGTGYYGMVFLGAEYFINKGLSVGVDIGPNYMVVGTNYGGLDLKSGSLDWVYNLSVNLYF